MQMLDVEYFRPVHGEGSGSVRALLPVGFHRADLSQVRRLCVDYFPRSVSRPRLMETLAGIVGLMNRAGFPAALWIDGDFVTESENPPSFDATLVLTQTVLGRLNKAQSDLFHWFRTTSLSDAYRCNNYTVVIDGDRRDGEIMHRYWVRQFGFDRAESGCGIIEILIPSLHP